MYSGPHIKRDGLVFGYDTGYGISDKDTSTRFYPGKPSTNEISDANLMSGWGSYSSGNDGTFTTEFGTVGYRINNRASWNGLYKDFSLPSTGTYTFSALFRYRGGSSSNNGATVYISGWGGSDTAIAIDKTKLNEWQRIEKTISVTDTTLRYYLISYGGSGAVSSWDVTMPQIELQSSRTPFLTGTRSSTQSLIDLTKTTDIDVSNVSFDSDGLPAFDGTDDFINTNQTPTELGIHSSSYTMEAIFKLNSTSGDSMVFGTNQTSQFNGLHNGVRNGVFYHAHYSADRNAGTAYANTWYHVIWVHTGSLSIMYVNGSPINSLASHGAFTSTYNVWIGRHWGYFGGKIPVAKIYNRALSAQEVKQNYNAYKNRFDI